jgi:hypothetical protein
MEIRIKYHSFINLITNSSSETFINATDSTVDTAKAIIDNILKAGGSSKTADELFSVRLDSYDSSLVVVAKDGSPEAAQAASELMGLVHSYDISSEFNG